MTALTRWLVSLNPCPWVDDFRTERPTRATRAPAIVHLTAR